MKRLPIALLATAALSGAASLQAQSFNYADRDLMLVFAQTGSPNLEVDIGSVLNYVNAAPGTILNITQYTVSQLNSAYPGLGNLNFAVIGAVRPGAGDATYPQNTLWLTAPRANVNTTALPWVSKSNSGQSIVSSTINGIAGNGSIAGSKPWSAGTALNPISNTSTAVIIPSSDPNSYTQLAGLVGNLNNTFGQGSIENTTPSVFSGLIRSDFYQMVPGSGNGVLKGFFDFHSDGTTTFTAVPEPGSVALLLGGLGLLFWAVRRSQPRVSADLSK